MESAVAPDLKHHLDAFLDGFPRERHVSNDPVQFVHRYDDPRDREVVGLIVSAFAYGNVKSILATADRALAFFRKRPPHALASFPPTQGATLLPGFYHRFNTSRDLAVFFWMLRRLLEDHGSLERAFASGLSATDENTGAAIARFSAAV